MCPVTSRPHRAGTPPSAGRPFRRLRPPSCLHPRCQRRHGEELTASESSIVRDRRVEERKGAVGTLAQGRVGAALPRDALLPRDAHTHLVTRSLSSSTGRHATSGLATRPGTSCGAQHSGSPNRPRSRRHRASCAPASRRQPTSYPNQAASRQDRAVQELPDQSPPAQVRPFQVPPDHAVPAAVSSRHELASHVCAHRVHLTGQHRAVGGIHHVLSPRAPSSVPVPWQRASSAQPPRGGTARFQCAFDVKYARPLRGVRARIGSAVDR